MYPPPKAIGNIAISGHQVNILAVISDVIRPPAKQTTIFGRSEDLFITENDCHRSLTHIQNNVSKFQPCYFIPTAGVLWWIPFAWWLFLIFPGETRKSVYPVW